MFVKASDELQLYESKLKRADVLRMLNCGMHVQDICKQLRVSTTTVCKVKKLYLQQGLSAALGIREFKTIHPYILGVLWAIGSYNGDMNVMLLRHSDFYFLQATKKSLGIRANIHKLGGYHSLKVSMSYLNIDTLRNLGWSERNSHDRPYPNNISEHRDFIRAYFEIHGRISKYRLTHKKSGRIQIQTRMRFYGNYSLLQSINEILSFELGIPERNLESTKKEHSKVLGYYRKKDILDILDWLYQDAGEYLHPGIKHLYEKEIK